MSEPNLMTFNQIVVEIFQRWANHQTDITIPPAMLLVWLKMIRRGVSSSTKQFLTKMCRHRLVEILIWQESRRFLFGQLTELMLIICS